MTEVIYSAIIGAGGVIIGIIISSIIEGNRLVKQREYELEDKVQLTRDNIIRSRCDSIETWVKECMKRDYSLYGCLISTNKDKKLIESLTSNNSSEKLEKEILIMLDAATLKLPGMIDLIKEINDQYDFLLLQSQKYLEEVSIDEKELITNIVKDKGIKLSTYTKCLELLDKSKVSSQYLSLQIEKKKVVFKE